MTPSPNLNQKCNLTSKSAFFIFVLFFGGAEGAAARSPPPPTVGYAPHSY
jgi:hypothetical protein